MSGGNLDAMAVVKIFAVLAVFGMFAAKLTLDKLAGKRLFRGGEDYPGDWTGDGGHGHHGGSWGGEDGGGHGDGGH